MNKTAGIQLTDNIYKQRGGYFPGSNKYAVSADGDVSVAYDVQWNG